MKKAIAIFIVSAINYAAEITIQIRPDSIYIGSLATISISVINLNEGENPAFPYIIEQPDVYKIIGRNLSDNSCDYNLQFWETGLIKIPSLTLSVSRNRQEIYELYTDTILIPVSSLINETNLKLAPIKPLHRFKLINPYMIFIYSLMIIIGIFMAIYLFMKNKIKTNVQESSGVSITSTFKKTINNLELLECPDIIDIETVEEYYLKLSYICRIFFKESLFIIATEMTSIELEIYFTSIGISEDLMKSWKQASKMSDMAKYAGQVPKKEQFIKHKKDLISIITKFHQHRHNVY